MSFEDWYNQYLYQEMFTESEESLNSSQYGSGPSDELIQLAFKTTVANEVQCIDPSILQLDPEQPDAEGMLSLSDHAVECNQGSEDLASPDELVSDISKVTESLMDIDEDLSGTAEASGVMETDEQFFDRTDVRELVNIHGPGISEIPKAPSSLGPGIQHPQGASSHAPPSSAPHPPSFTAPPPVPLYAEAGVGLYLSARVVQAWGTHNGRQYLIRWEGLPPEFDSWVLAINLSGQLIAEFERCLIRYRIN